MQIRFLGTAAANAYPEAFCACDNCRQARALGGPSLRKRSAALIDDELLIDLGPDIMAAAQQHGWALTNVAICLQTHPHADHLDLSHLLSRSAEYGTVGAPQLHLYASHETLQRAAQTFERDLEGYSLLSPEAERRLNLKLYTVAAGVPFLAGRYQVTPFPANHAPGMGALMYSVQRGGRTLLYATDTAALPEATWQALHQGQARFDMVVLDHTYGPGQPGGDHMSAQQVAEMVARMRREGLLKPGGRAFATHIAHEGNPPHPQLAAYARGHGYEVAHDGLDLAV